MKKKDVYILIAILILIVLAILFKDYFLNDNVQLSPSPLCGSSTANTIIHDTTNGCRQCFYVSGRYMYRYKWVPVPCPPKKTQQRI